MNVGEVLKAKGTGVITVSPGEAVWSVLRKYRVHQIGTLVVVDDGGELLGLLSERDLVNGLITQGKRLLDQPVRDVMSTGVATCRPDDAVGQILHTMTDRRTRHMPVIEDGELIGMISIGDVVKTALSDAEAEVKVLRDIARIRR
jgi:CBS domain-containing protein